MSIAASPTVAERLSLALDGLARSVAGRIVTGMMSAVMIVLVWQRVRRAERLIVGMLARFQAGTLRVSGSSRPAGGAVGRRGGARLPQGFGWLLPLVPCEAACFAGQIRTMLAEPDMAALIAAAPQARRVLRPLCRMLGIEGERLREAPARMDDPIRQGREEPGDLVPGNLVPGDLVSKDGEASWVTPRLSVVRSVVLLE